MPNVPSVHHENLPAFIHAHYIFSTSSRTHTEATQHGHLLTHFPSRRDQYELWTVHRHIDAHTHITFTFSWCVVETYNEHSCTKTPDTKTHNVPRVCLPPSPRRAVSPGGTSKVTYVWVCAWEQKGKCIKEENREFIFVISGTFICTVASPFWKRDALR